VFVDWRIVKMACRAGAYFCSRTACSSIKRAELYNSKGIKKKGTLSGKKVYRYLLYKRKSVFFHKREQKMLERGSSHRSLRVKLSSTPHTKHTTERHPFSYHGTDCAFNLFSFFFLWTNHLFSVIACISDWWSAHSSSCPWLTKGFQRASCIYFHSFFFALIFFLF
jgi:hypothetical protein